ncbi:MAG: Murein DD-endopeptidase MepH precursor [Syntrophaceae bacterium PtaU1.Bin231]|nr:MAG: Murein DD-endopeptidase MepH precursor [Syntrophaceae bacterium PtaU1.Bin231]
MKANVRRCRGAAAWILAICLLFTAGCGGRHVQKAETPVKPKPAEPVRAATPRLGYSIQAGAFANVENAARLTEALKAKGLDAYYFVFRKDLYKVRFGNFPTKADARERAEELKEGGVIGEFYIVTPEEYALSKSAKLGGAYLRAELVRTARSFMGVPYLWGGTSPEAGFDCSGLAMAVYQLNGINIPRSSREQFEAGNPVQGDCLAGGDLVFFATAEPGKASHVGIYAGRGRFIHAPGKGKRIRMDSLDGDYYGARYVGSRSYL